MLHRVIYASEAVGATGASTLSIAQILGVSDRNNRRDRVSGCLMFHQGHILQALEGERADLDRLMSLAREVNPRLRFVLTVSPVPLVATATREHVLVATMPARAALISGLCQELSSMAKMPPLGNVPAAR